MRARLVAIGIGGLGVAAVAAAGVVLAGGGDDGNPAASSSAAAAPAQPEATPPGPRAPALGGTDPITGAEVSLSDFQGTPVVVNIWASWCPPCAEEAPDLAALAVRHPEAVVLGIDFQDSVPGAKRFYKQYGWRHPSIFDPEGKLTAKLGLLGLPTTIFLSSDHREVSRIVGPGDLAAFERGLVEAKQASRA